MDLIQFIKEIQSIPLKERHENYFRGHSDRSFELIPSIYRNGLIGNEDSIFKEAILRTPHEFINCKSTIEKLVKMQHYGIPTRLLDVTSNPLVALYFACNENFDNDGQVLFFQIPTHYVKFYDSDTISVLSNIAKRPSPFSIGVPSRSIEEFNETFEMEYLHHEIKEEKPYFKSIINPKHIEKVFAVKVKLDNPRILKQNGAFLIFGISANKTRPADVDFRWRIESVTKFVVPKEDKMPILSELDALGINQSTLFPEIEYQGLHLKNKYKKY